MAELLFYKNGVFSFTLPDYHFKDMKTDQRKKFAVIVAGGKGARMASSVPKQFLMLNGKPVLYYSLAAFINAYPDIRIILVHPENELQQIHEALQWVERRDIILVKGGATRFASVKNGLERVSASSVIFIHDGVRPLVSTDLIHRCYEHALVNGNAIPVLPLKDSIRKIWRSDKGEDHSTAEDRNSYRMVQTPQVFLSEIILPAFDRPYDAAFTDEATVVEKSGGVIHLIRGQEQNIKITEPDDLWLASQLLQKRDN